MITRMNQKLPKEPIAREPIAIIGMGCRFPQSPNLKAFEQLLVNGFDAITEVPSDRWSIAEFYDRDPQTPGKMNSRWGGFLGQVDLFDAKFFNISPREAPYIDPQQRLVLEVAWESLEDAAIAPDSLAGSPTGVFVGIGNFDYGRLLCRDDEKISVYNGTGLTLSMAANRLSYLLDLHGPAMAIETACSSSLYATHLACQSLLQGECDIALAGGVSLLISPDMTITFSQARMLSVAGRCQTFDAKADGYVRGEGCGMIVLKRLSDALGHGDNILALIRGSAINHDGFSNGITAPNGLAQQEVIRQALKNAGVAPQEISYIEAHGTGTALGDPIEIRALKAVLLEGRNQENRCAIGSVKTNIGHLENAAGIAGMIKVVLALQEKQLFPHLHLNQLNPYLEIEDTPFFIPTESQPWQPSQSTRLAGVSGFSFGGANCHVILEEAPTNPIDSNSEERPLHLISLSAKSLTALQALVQRHQTFLVDHPQVSVADLGFSLNTGRSHFAQRLAVIAADRQQMVQLLQAFTEEKATPGLVTGKISRRRPPKIAFVFTGQGAQYLGMGQQLYQTQTTFRRILDQCDQILRPHLGKSLIELLYSDNSEGALLNETAYTQPALFAIAYALTQLWKSWGIEPNALIGHSLGEYAAACVAGVFSLEEGLNLIVQRAQLMQSLPPGGSMVAVFADEATVSKVLTEFDSSLVSIATLNSAQNTVISGQASEMQKIVKILEQQGIKTHPLKVSHSFHSPLIDPILDRWEEIAEQFQFAKPKIPLVSNLTGNFFSEQAIPDAHYWRCQTRSPVRFKEGIDALLGQGYELFVEIGPKPILCKLGQRWGQGTWLPSLVEGETNWQSLTSSLAVIYTQGSKINWQGWDQDYTRHRLSLPTYPFQRQRYWIEESSGNMSETNHNSTPPQSQNQEQKQKMISELSVLVGNLLHIPVAEVDCRTPLLEMGADSLVLLDAVREIENIYGLKISINQLFEVWPTIEALGTHLAEQLPVTTSLETSSSSKSNGVGALEVTNELNRTKQQCDPQTSQSRESLTTVNGQNHSTKIIPQPIEQEPGVPSVIIETAAERIMSQQLQIMAQQLEILQGKSVNNHQQRQQVNGKSSSYSDLPNQIIETNNSPSREKKKFLPRLTPAQSPELTPQQQQHLQALIRRYSQRTQKSKQRAEFSRPMLADSRAVAGFRPSIKEMLYPIVGEKAQGSRFWDLDGNEYLDITMGFGVLLLGHNSPVITQAIQAQLQKGLQIGPQANLVTETANLIRELTGVERVTFCNSGTEAVMTALRLARTVTKRKKIALFSGSYHGHFDGVLALAAPGSTKAIPMSLGVTENAVQELLVLEYDNPQSLEILADHASELAGVLVEPVPSRRPNLQPQAFLQQLRKFTQAADIPLIFDEVLVGFRIHPGGAQAWFDLEADIVTYGKIVGGGLPIGVVAGKAKYLDGIDGGQWNYGDNSYPTAAKTFFAGTFNKNHLGMAAACAMLRYLKQEGASLQQQLNTRTAKLAQTLNRYFAAEEIPLQLIYFGSLFRFASNANIDLLYYHLLEKGVYIWEGRNCFLSTAHSDKDLEFLIQAIQESVIELRQGGFLIRQTTKIKEVAQPKKSALPEQSSLSSSDKRSQPEPQANLQNSCKLLTPRAIYQGLASQITEITQHREIVNYPQAFIQLEKLSFAYIIQAFEQLGWKFRLNEQFSSDAIAEKLNIDSQYRKIFDRLLEILAQESIIAPLESNWQVAKIPQSRDTQEFAQQILAKYPLIKAKYPLIKAELNLLNRCGQALSEVLQGKRHPLQLIFPQGDLSSSTELYQESPLARLMNSLVQKSISLALLPFSQNQQEPRTRVENKVRILEIGAGTGGTTAGILPHLPQQQVEYYFTDISPLFINRAKQKFQDYPFVKYGTLDIEEEPTSQSLGNLQYDIVVAANVLHSTAKLAHTLQHIRQLLSPGGILVILEGTAPQRWLDLIFGLTEGWWKFSDRALRPNYPLISATQWQTLLQEQGFTETITLPDRSPLSNLQAVIVARRPHQVPLTKAQKQLWALAKINQEGSIAYNESVRLELKGPLQVEVMCQAVQQVIDRHEALRIVIDSLGETQEILPSWKIEIPYLDFSQAEPTEVTDWLTKTVKKPFDMSEKPLLRVEIVKLAPELHWLVITIHHIISDGWSIDVICQDLGKFYAAQCQGISLQLMPPRQFSDYIQNQHCFQEQRQKEEAYWLEQFSSPISHLELPTDYPRPSVQTYQGKQQSTIIAAPIMIALQNLSHQQGATLFMTLLTSFNLFLQHLSGQKDLVIGISAAGQLAVGWKDLVGYCVNVLPLRFNLDKTTFLDHLKSVKELLLQAYKYQNYPYAQLLEKLKLKRNPSSPPLISVQFNLDRFGKWLDFGELEVQGITNFPRATRRDLTWNLTEMQGNLTLTATYNRDLFKSETIKHWLKEFGSLLQIVGQQPEITTSAIFQHLREFDQQQNQRKEQQLHNMAVKKLKRIKRKTINREEAI